MGKVITFSDRYRRHRNLTPLTDDEPREVISLEKEVTASTRIRLLEEYTGALVKVEYQCQLLIRKRRFKLRHSEEFAFRAASVFNEYTDTIEKFLREHDPSAQTLHYFGTIGYCISHLFGAINEFGTLPQVYTLEVSDAVRELEFYLNSLRAALEQVFTVEGLSLPKTAYKL